MSDNVCQTDSCKVDEQQSAKYPQTKEFSCQVKMEYDYTDNEIVENIVKRFESTIISSIENLNMKVDNERKLSDTYEKKIIQDCNSELKSVRETTKHVAESLETVSKMAHNMELYTKDLNRTQEISQTIRGNLNAANDKIQQMQLNLESKDVDNFNEVKESIRKLPDIQLKLDQSIEKCIEYSVNLDRIVQNFEDNHDKHNYSCSVSNRFEMLEYIVDNENTVKDENSNYVIHSPSGVQVEKHNILQEMEECTTEKVLSTMSNFHDTKVKHTLTKQSKTPVVVKSKSTQASKLVEETKKNTNQK